MGGIFRLKNSLLSLRFFNHPLPPRAQRDVPDYALNKHTLRGKQLKRGHDHFWTEGAKIENIGDVLDPTKKKRWLHEASFKTKSL